MEIQTRTDKGRIRPVNEDAVLHFSTPEYEIVLLADGLGGHRAGEVASQMVVETMRDYLLDHGLAHVETAMRNAAEHANAAVYRSQKEDRERAGMGSTLVAAVLGEDVFHIAHAGDSRAYLWDANRLHLLTRDHSVSNDLRNDTREMSENLRHMLTRAMGTEPSIRIDYQIVEAAAGPLLLLCSDGLSNEMNIDEMEAILRKDIPLSEKADELLQSANENGGKDNITLALCAQKGAAK